MHTVDIQSDAPQTARKPAKIHVSKWAKCKCNHRKISAHSTRQAHVFIDTQCTHFKKKKGHKTQHISTISPIFHLFPISLHKHNLHVAPPRHIFAHPLILPNLSSSTPTSFPLFASRSSPFDPPRKHHLITLTPVSVSRIIQVRRSCPRIDPEEADQHLQSC